MKRVLLDTNVYGSILIDNESDKVKEGIERSPFLLCGNDVIRKELKMAPRKTGSYAKNLRMDLIRLFDELVKQHFVAITLGMEDLAGRYYIVYKEVGGFLSKQKLWNDFLIVACATLKNMDVVVSDDQNSMLNRYATSAYNIVNKLEGRRTPVFIGYNDFKKTLVRRWPL